MLAYGKNDEFDTKHQDSALEDVPLILRKGTSLIWGTQLKVFF